MALNTSYAVRLERKIVDKIKPIAAANRRSLKGQIEVVLQSFVRDVAASGAAASGNGAKK